MLSRRSLQQLNDSVLPHRCRPRSGAKSAQIGGHCHASQIILDSHHPCGTAHDAHLTTTQSADYLPTSENLIEPHHALPHDQSLPVLCLGVWSGLTRSCSRVQARRLESCCLPPFNQGNVRELTVSLIGTPVLGKIQRRRAFFRFDVRRC
jgi:hypothetical protein